MIIVFDSGIGGFSLLQEMRREGLTTPVLYLADQANFPYGSKSESWLAARLASIAKWAAGYNPQVFVLACNTATVAAIETIRNILPCPVVGVEPVVKPLSAYSKALVLATQVTASSARTKELLTRFGGHVQLVSAPGLAVAIENNDNDQVKIILKNIAETVSREKIQAIGLSCTHYPLVSDCLQSLLPAVHLYDPSQAVVHQLKKYLSPPVGRKQESAIEFVTTGGVVRFNEQISHYLQIATQAKKVTI